MSIKLIAIDMDGTWLRGDCSISQKTKETIQRAIEAGYCVVPTTGRSFRNSVNVLQDCEGLRYFINANGSTVTDALEEQVIYTEAMPYETAREIYDLSNQYESFLEIYEELDAHVDKYGREFLLRAGLSGDYVEQLLSTNVEHDCLDDFMESTQRRICKFHIVCSSADIASQLKRKISQIPDIYPLSVFPLNIEVVNGTWSKASGLKKLTEHLGLTSSEVMAIGDSDNDYDMICWAGTSVAMGNGNKKVKEAADYIVSSNDEDGVAEALEKYLKLDEKGREQ